MAFSATYVKGLRPKGRRYEVWEGNGFGLRVSPAGTKSWILVYHFEGRPRRFTLGKFMNAKGQIAMTLAEARAAAGEAMQSVERGKDPGSEAVQTRRQSRVAETVGELIDAYIEGWAKPRKRSWKEDRALLERHVRARWGRRKAASITRRDVRTLNDDLVGRGMQAGANRVFAVVRKMFNYALDRDIIEHSPCAGVRRPAPEKSRERFLNRRELRAFLETLPKARMTDSSRLVFRFQLLTACRISEAAEASWDEFSVDEAVWLIPAERAKNGRAHRVPLSRAALDLLAEARRLGKFSRWVFPAYRTDGPKKGDSMAQMIRNNRPLWRKAGIEDFTPHDLRRTVGSLMPDLGVSEVTIDKILNHIDNSMRAVYVLHSYDREKREALDLWAAELKRIANCESRNTSGVSQ